MAHTCMIPFSSLSNLVDRDPTVALSPQEKQFNAHLDSCPDCQRKVASLTKLHSLAQASLAEETQEQEKNMPWLDSLLNDLMLEAKAGRSIPISSDNPNFDLSQTEGAVVAAARAAADQLEGLVMGRCRLIGDLEAPGSPIQVQIDLSVSPDKPIPEVSEELRRLLYREFDRISELKITGIDIRVQDLLTSRKKLKQQ